MVAASHFLCLLFVLSYYTSSAQKPVVRVALASSLTPMMERLLDPFEQSHDIEIQWIPGASGTLTSQIMHGAPYDIFVSAQKKYTQLLQEQGHVQDGPIDWIKGGLILWTNLPLASQDRTPSNEEILNFLRSTKVKTIAIAQPGLAPYGDEALSYLQALGAGEVIEKKLLFGTNVAITNQYIFTQSVDVAITALSTKFSLVSSTPGSWYNINHSPSDRLTHSICLLNNDADEMATELYLYLISSDLSAIQEQFGYQVLK